MRTTVMVSVEEGVGRMVLNHPPLNILTREILAYMRSELERLAAVSALRALVISSEGKHFSAGADVSEHMAPEYRDMIPEFIATVRAIDEFPLPVIAAVHGRCLGGAFELVQAVDMVVAGKDAVFGQPEIALGVLPPAACVLLPEMCSRGAAAEMVFTGDSIDAVEAERLGIVHRLVPNGNVEGEALALAKSVAKHSGAALRLAKRALRMGSAATRAAALSGVGDLYVRDLMSTHDAVEGLDAFVEKRPPAWSHS
jgi:cyclohexa-1,5-dienecarbonyl-CoA hydratase